MSVDGFLWHEQISLSGSFTEAQRECTQEYCDRPHEILITNRTHQRRLVKNCGNHPCTHHLLSITNLIIKLVGCCKVILKFPPQ